MTNAINLTRLIRVRLMQLGSPLELEEFYDFVEIRYLSLWLLPLSIDLSAVTNRVNHYRLFFTNNLIYHSVITDTKFIEPYEVP